MTDKNIKDIVDNMLKQAGTPDPNILAPNGRPVGAPDEMEMVAMAIQNLEMGLIQVARAQENVGMILDTARLTLQMTLNMLIEKNVFTKEEIDARYKKDVAEPIMQHRKEMQEQMQKQMAEAKAEAEAAQQTTEECSSKCSCENSCCKEEESDIVLPSERAGNVVRFPTKKDN